MTLSNNISNVDRSLSEGALRWSYEYSGKRYVAELNDDFSKQGFSFSDFSAKSPFLHIKSESGELIASKKLMDLNRSRNASFSNIDSALGIGDRLNKLPFFSSSKAREETLALKGADILLADKQGPYVYMLNHIKAENYRKANEVTPVRRFSDEKNRKEILEFFYKGDKYELELKKDENGLYNSFALSKNERNIFASFMRDGKRIGGDGVLDEGLKFGLTQAFLDNSFGLGRIKDQPMMKQMFDFEDVRLDFNKEIKNRGVEVKLSSGLNLYTNLYRPASNRSRDSIVMKINGKDVLDGAEYEPALVDNFSRRSITQKDYVKLNGFINYTDTQFSYGGRKYMLKAKETYIKDENSSFKGNISTDVSYELFDCSVPGDRRSLGKFGDKDLRDKDMFVLSPKSGIADNLKRAIVDYNLGLETTNPKLKLDMKENGSYKLDRKTAYGMTSLEKDRVGNYICSVDNGSKKPIVFMGLKADVLRDKIVSNSSIDVSSIKGLDAMPFGSNLDKRKEVVYGYLSDLYSDRNIDRVLTKLGRNRTELYTQQNGPRGFKPQGIAIS